MRIMRNERKKGEGDEEAKEVRENAHFMHAWRMTMGWNETNTRTS